MGGRREGVSSGDMPSFYPLHFHPGIALSGRPPMVPYSPGVSEHGWRLLMGKRIRGEYRANHLEDIAMTSLSQLARKIATLIAAGAFAAGVAGSATGGEAEGTEPESTESAP